MLHRNDLLEEDVIIGMPFVTGVRRWARMILKIGDPWYRRRMLAATIQREKARQLTPGVVSHLPPRVRTIWDIGPWRDIPSIPAHRRHPWHTNAPANVGYKVTMPFEIPSISRSFLSELCWCFNGEEEGKSSDAVNPKEGIPTWYQYRWSCTVTVFNTINTLIDASLCQHRSFSQRSPSGFRHAWYRLGLLAFLLGSKPYPFLQALRKSYLGVLLYGIQKIEYNRVYNSWLECNWKRYFEAMILAWFGCDITNIQTSTTARLWVEDTFPESHKHRQVLISCRWACLRRSQVQRWRASWRKADTKLARAWGRHLLSGASLPV